MDGRVRRAFDSVKADAGLKARTRARVAQRMRARARAHVMPRIALAVMCVLLMSVGGMGYLRPVSAISLDVNPSVELALNLFDRVVSARGLNAEGEALISGMNLFGRDYRDAIDAIAGSDAMAQYLTDGNTIDITVACDSEQRSAALLAGVSDCSAVARGNACCYEISGELAQQARETGVSPGKYRLMLELMGLDATVTAEQARALSMSELRARISELGGSVEGCGLDGCDGSNCAVHGGLDADAPATGAPAAQSSPAPEAVCTAAPNGGNGQGNGDGSGNGQGNGDGSGNGHHNGSANGQHNGNGSGQMSGNGHH